MFSPLEVVVPTFWDTTFFSVYGFSKGTDEQQKMMETRGRLMKPFVCLFVCLFFSLWAVQHPKVLGIGVAGLAVRWPRWFQRLNTPPKITAKVMVQGRTCFDFTPRGHENLVFASSPGNVQNLGWFYPRHSYPSFVSSPSWIGLITKA